MPIRVTTAERSFFLICCSDSSWLSSSWLCGVGHVDARRLSRSVDCEHVLGMSFLVKPPPLFLRNCLCWNSRNCSCCIRWKFSNSFSCFSISSF